MAAFAVGIAIFQHGGEYTPPAIRWITLAIFASAGAVWLHRSTGSFSLSRGQEGWREGKVGSERRQSLQEANATVSSLPLPRAPGSGSQRTLLCVATILVVVELGCLLRLWPVGVDQSILSPFVHHLYQALIIFAAIVVCFGFFTRNWLSRLWFPLLLAIHAALGIWTVKTAPSPKIDVWVFQQRGPEVLLRGHNPYDWRQVQFPDIYLSTHGDHQRVYGEGLVENDVLKFGFPYPPLSLYCSTLGYLLGGDTRYAQALALTLAGLLLGYSRPGKLVKMAAALLLFTPTVWFVLGRGWTEPFVVFFLALTLFCASRRLRVLPIAFGLFLASKQYLMFALPLSFLLLEAFSWRAWGKLLLEAGLTAAAVTLPMALRDFHSFWFSLVTVQKVAPFRWDSLSYLTWIGLNIDSKFTSWGWIAFALAPPAMGLCLWRCRRSAGGFSLAMGFVYLLFISFNKQAFCNYYFFVIGCLCGAAADAPPAALPSPPASDQCSSSLEFADGVSKIKGES